MLQTGESENEILLGNKQLLAIFFVVVLLLGVAFAGGYKLGQASKKGVVAVAGTDTAQANGTQTAGQTHDVTPGDGGGDATTTAAPVADSGNTAAAQPAAEPAQDTPAQTEPSPKQEAPLGAPKHTVKSAPPPSTEDTEAPAPPPPSRPERSGEFVPQTGQLFLQVAAVGRDEAEAVADVLHKKGFRAHAVPKPGNPKIYRVLIGPLKDASDLNSTRDSLRRTGFREVITQRY